MAAAVIITGIVGAVLAVLGYLIWKKEMISLLNEYHRGNVAEEDKKAFCALSGIGVAVIGISLLLTAVMLAVTDSALSFIAFGVGFAAGLVMLVLAGIKYN